MAEANIPDVNLEKSEENCENKENTSMTNIEETADTSIDSMDKFLQKSRSELMFELRRLQHGDRPVTGQGHKEMVDDFFAKRFQAMLATNQNENIPSNVDNVEQHRPEAVVVEVQGLYDQHRVSSMLQSQQFRRQLESIIRGSVQAAPRRPQPPIPSPRRQRVLLRDNPPPAALRPDSSDDESSSSESLDLADVEQHPARTSIPLQNRSQDLPRNYPPGAVEIRPIITWPQISDVQQEDMINEIRELVHQRLVSESLNGAFRGTLEVTMQNRVPENGAAVAEFIRSIDQSEPIRRNDFSHLGIETGNVDDTFDDISVTSISATAIPYNHSNLRLSREISSLKSQMSQMANMLKVSFDLQMDIQRSIRQEVSAAINTAQGASHTAIPESQPVQDDKCVICLDNYSDTVLYRCGHMCLCYTCGKDLQNRGLNCPVCRAPIRDIIKAYRSNKQ